LIDPRREPPFDDSSDGLADDGASNDEPERLASRKDMRDLTLNPYLISGRASNPPIQYGKLPVLGTAYVVVWQQRLSRKENDQALSSLRTDRAVGLTVPGSGSLQKSPLSINPTPISHTATQS
jgi:hypothetical protein